MIINYVDIFSVCFSAFLGAFLAVRMDRYYFVRNSLKNIKISSSIEWKKNEVFLPEIIKDIENGYCPRFKLDNLFVKSVLTSEIFLTITSKEFLDMAWQYSEQIDVTNRLIDQWLENRNNDSVDEKIKNSTELYLENAFNAMNSYLPKMGSVTIQKPICFYFYTDLGDTYFSQIKNILDGKFKEHKSKFLKLFNLF